VKSLTLVSLAAVVFVAAAIPAPAQQGAIPKTWQVNGNGYTGLLVLNQINPATNEVSGTLLGTPATGYLVGRHLVLHRYPQGSTQIWDGWILDPRLGAQGQPYYDGTLIIAGVISESKGAIDGVYPWYAVAQGQIQAPPIQPPAPPPAVTSVQQFVTSRSYQVDVFLSTVFHSTWRIQVVNGRITGTSEWTCCPGPRVDQLRGTFQGDTVVIERDCSGQNWSGSCTQVFTGRLVNGRIEGTCQGTGIPTPHKWVMY
jgi:hypothetical protein